MDGPRHRQQGIKAARTGLSGFKDKKKDMKLEEVGTGEGPGGVGGREEYDQTT